MASERDVKQMTVGRKVAYAFMGRPHHERLEIWQKMGFREPNDESTLGYDTAGFTWLHEQGC